MKFKGVDYYNIEELLSEDERIVRNTARDFLEKEFRPLIKDSFNLEKSLNWRYLAPKLGELGFIGSIFPLECGGGGTNYTTYGIISQEAERIDSVVGGFIREQTALVMYPIWYYGSEEQKRKWLPFIARGEKIGCFG